MRTSGCWAAASWAAALPDVVIGRARPQQSGRSLIYFGSLVASVRRFRSAFSGLGEFGSLRSGRVDLVRVGSELVGFYVRPRGLKPDLPHNFYQISRFFSVIILREVCLRMVMNKLVFDCLAG